MLDTYYNIPISHKKFSKEYNPNFIIFFLNYIFGNIDTRKSFYTIMTKLKGI